MWIKHNKAIYNSSYILKVEAKRTKLVATFSDGEEVIIGEFRAMKECEDILKNVVQALLFEDKDRPGIIIKDTKVAREKK